MARSFLAAQIAEVRDGLQGLAGDLKNLGQVNSQILSRSVGVQAGAPGGGGGGGNGLPPGTVLGPSGAPVGGFNMGGPTLGASSIADFLRRLSEGEAGRKDSSASSGASGSGGGGSIEKYERPADQREQSLMKSLGESLEYIRKLMAAAQWAKLTEWTVLRAPKAERDALIAAYEAAMEKTKGSTTSSGGSTGYVETRTQYVDPLGNYNPLSRLPPGAPGHMTPLRPPAMSSQTAASSAPTAGDRFVAEAVGGVTRAIDKLSSKIDSQGNLAFRTKGL